MAERLHQPAEDPIGADGVTGRDRLLHDLNNLLMIIVMQADLVRGDLGPEHPDHDRIKSILSAVDRGSGIIRQLLALSQRQPAHPPVSDADAAVAGYSKGSGTILLAEDEPMVRNTVMRVLTSAGYKVLLAASGNEAKLVVQDNEGRFDLIVTDMMMPNGTGRDLAEFVAEAYPAIPVLFMTGYTEDPVVGDSAALQSRGWQALPKPFRPQELLQTVASLIPADPAPMTSANLRPPAA